MGSKKPAFMFRARLLLSNRAMTLTQIAQILRARWRSAVVVFLCVFGAVVVLTLVLPKGYAATGAVVLDVKSPDPIAGVVLPGMTVSGYMATQVDVLQSERVLLRAIRELKLDKDAESRDDWQAATEGRGDFNSWLADRISRKLDVKPGKESNVILVSYTHRDPVYAAKVANAVVSAYIETVLELRTEPAKQFNALFDESTKALRDSVEKAQKRLSDYQQKSGIAVDDERIDVENARLNDLANQVTQAQALANEQASRQGEAARRGEMQEVLTNPTVTALNADLALQVARLHELTGRLGERNPQVIDLRANISKLREQLAGEKARITSSIATNANVSASKLEGLRAALEQQRGKVMKMKLQRDDASVLQRDLENAQKSYEAAFTKRSQSALESQATQTNVSVIKVATPPAFPTSPKVPLNLAIGLLLGGALAIAIAVLRERRDWRLRTEADVMDALNQPLLGVLPDKPRLAVSRSRIAAERIMGRPSLLGR